MGLKGRTIWIRAKVVDESEELLSIYGLEDVKIKFDENKGSIGNSDVRCLFLDNEIQPVDRKSILKKIKVGQIWENTNDRYVRISGFSENIDGERLIAYKYFDDHRNWQTYFTTINSTLAWRLFKDVD